MPMSLKTDKRFQLHKIACYAKLVHADMGWADFLQKLHCRLEAVRKHTHRYPNRRITPPGSSDLLNPVFPTLVTKLIQLSDFG